MKAVRLVPVEFTSTNGETPDTVMVSSIEPTFITMSSFATNPTVNRMSSRRTP